MCPINLIVSTTLMIMAKNIARLQIGSQRSAVSARFVNEMLYASCSWVRIMRTSRNDRDLKGDEYKTQLTVNNKVVIFIEVV